MPSSYFCFHTQWSLKTATQIFSFKFSKSISTHEKNKAEQLPKVVHIYSKCVACVVLHCISMYHDRRYYVWLRGFFCHLPLPFVELSVTVQLGSNNHTLLICFTHNYTHTDSCVSAGVWHTWDRPLADRTSIYSCWGYTLSSPKQISMILGLLLP